MVYAAQELGAATGNIFCCSGASPEGDTVQPEGPHCQHYSTCVQYRQCCARSQRETRLTYWG